MGKFKASVVSALVVAVIVSLYVFVRPSRETRIDAEVQEQPTPGVCGGTAETISRCQELELLGIVSVRCPFDVNGNYAVGGEFAYPDDTCDDKLAIQRALKHALSSRTVYFPPGTGSNKYLVSETIDLGLTRIRGEKVSHMSPSNGTRIGVLSGSTLLGTAACETLPSEELTIAASLMPAVNPGDCRRGAVFSSALPNDSSNHAVVDISDMTIDAAGAHYGVFIQAPAHGSQLNNVAVLNAVRVGVLVNEANFVRLDRVLVETGLGDGVILTSASMSTLSNSTVRGNARHGVVVARRSGSLGNGAASILNGLMENNFTLSPQPVGHGVYILGTIGTVTVRETVSRGNGLDALRVANSQNAHLLRNDAKSVSRGSHPAIPGHNQPESINHAISLLGCRHCIVEGNVVRGIVSENTNVEDIWLESYLNHGQGYVYVSKNMYDGVTGAGLPYLFDYLGSVPWPNTFGAKLVVLNDAAPHAVNSVYVTSQHQTRELQASAPPATGVGTKWRPGDTVWQAVPVPGAAAGWMCQNTGAYDFDCANWRPMGALQQ